jgi:hypothetical protein
MTLQSKIIEFQQKFSRHLFQGQTTRSRRSQATVRHKKRSSWLMIMILIIHKGRRNNRCKMNQRCLRQLLKGNSKDDLIKVLKVLIVKMGMWMKNRTKKRLTLSSTGHYRSKDKTQPTMRSKNYFPKAPLERLTISNSC